MLARTWRCASRGLSTPRLHSCLLGRVLLIKIHIRRKGFLLGAGHAGSDSWHPAPARHTLTFSRGTTYQLCFLLERHTFLSTVLHRSCYQRVACCWEMAGMCVEFPRGVRPHSFSRPGCRVERCELRGDRVVYLESSLYKAPHRTHAQLTLYPPSHKRSAPPFLSTTTILQATPYLPDHHTRDVPVPT